MKSDVKRNSILLHALASPENKALVTRIATERRLPVYDLTGGAVDFLRNATGWREVPDPDRVHSSGAAYFDRIDAWEFTMQHDDSRRLETIRDADIVLLGLSRVSKTPTSAYLGWLGHRVANISFVPDLGLPDQVKKCRRKAVALTMRPRRLSEIRNRRMERNGFQQPDRDDLPQIRYSGLRDTIREVAAAEKIYRQLKIPIVDVTDATVEETAARILEVMDIE